MEEGDGEQTTLVMQLAESKLKVSSKNTNMMREEKKSLAANGYFWREKKEKEK